MVTVVLIILFPLIAHAKFSKEFKKAFEETFVPAIPHKGLETAASPIETDKLRTFVVVEKDKLIPAERAFYLIEPGDYDYISAIVEEDGRLKKRRGDVYTYLLRGAVMAVAGVRIFGNTAYIKLLSVDKVDSIIYPKKRPTRVAVMLGFKFGKAEMKGGDVSAMIRRMEEWVKPFATYSKAIAYSTKIH